jgi:hypothetical protein
VSLSGRFAALERGLKKGLTFRDQRGKARRASRAQSLPVRGVFDKLIAIIGAPMGCEFG